MGAATSLYASLDLDADGEVNENECSKNPSCHYLEGTCVCEKNAFNQFNTGARSPDGSALLENSHVDVVEKTADGRTTQAACERNQFCSWSGDLCICEKAAFKSTAQTQ